MQFLRHCLSPGPSIATLFNSAVEASMFSLEALPRAVMPWLIEGFLLPRCDQVDMWTPRLGQVVSYIRPSPVDVPKHIPTCPQLLLTLSLFPGLFAATWRTNRMRTWTS